MNKTMLILTSIMICLFPFVSTLAAESEQEYIAEIELEYVIEVTYQNAAEPLRLSPSEILNQHIKLIENFNINFFFNPDFCLDEFNIRKTLICCDHMILTTHVAESQIYKFGVGYYFVNYKFWQCLTCKAVQ